MPLDMIHILLDFGRFKAFKFVQPSAKRRENDHIIRDVRKPEGLSAPRSVGKIEFIFPDKAELFSVPRPLTKSGWTVVVLFLSVLDGCLKLVYDAKLQAKCFFSACAVEWNEAHVVHVNLLPCFVSSF